MTVDASGLTIPTIEELLADTVAEQRANVDSNIDTDTEEPVGQLNGVYIPKVRELYETLQIVNNALDPFNAEGMALATVCSLTGTQRRPVKFSFADVTLGLDAGATVFKGSIVQHSDDPSIRFLSDLDVTAGLAGDYIIRFTCDTPGDISAVAGKLSVIASPVSGWNTATNATDATRGNDIESDTALRIRRELQLQRIGSATPDGIRSDVLDLDDAVSVQVYENDTEEIDSNGLRPWSIEVVVYDGTPGGSALDRDLIAQSIYDSRAAATDTFGNTSGTAIKADGDEKKIKFSRPVEKLVWIELTVTGSFDPDLVKAALVNLANGPAGIQLPGVDVISLRYEAEPLNVPGVTNVTAFAIGFTASPTADADLIIGVRDIAALDTSRIIVTVI